MSDLFGAVPPPPLAAAAFAPPPPPPPPHHTPAAMPPAAASASPAAPQWQCVCGAVFARRGKGGHVKNCAAWLAAKGQPPPAASKRKPSKA